MVISQPQNNPSYYYRVTNAASLYRYASPRHLMFYTYNYNIRVTHRGNGAIKHVLHESDPRRDHQQIVLYSFCRALHALALHLAVKILLQIFLYEDLSTLLLHTSVSLYFLQKYCKDRTLLRNQYY